MRTPSAYGRWRERDHMGHVYNPGSAQRILVKDLLVWSARGHVLGDVEKCMDWCFDDKAIGP